MSKQSPLTELHRTRGADFVEAEGWILPLHFGDSPQEYRTVRSRVGLLDLCHHGLLRFTGPDRISFLQGMVSNDVKNLASGQGVYAAVLDIQGKILADTRIFCMGESFLLDLWEPLKEKIFTHLNRYLIADDVEITDLTGQFAIISLQGPEAQLFLSELLQQGKIPLRELDHRPFQIDDAEIRLVRSTHTGEKGYDFLIPIGSLKAVVLRIEETGKRFSLQWVGTQAQEILRTEAGIPRYGIDMDENNLLLETGLEQAVSFQKGCYLGQEVVERIHTRGHVNKKLVGMLLDGDTAAERGNTIRAEEKEIGKVTTSILSPALKRPLALGYVHRDYLRPGTLVSINRHGKAIPAEISPLPFYKPSPSVPS
ncbi:MAG: aminomethyltransferase family protein [Deltaproteobacteria bacterium]|nr:aminomethyltransferase family protein [Deltaproteobacteria bacterium]